MKQATDRPKHRVTIQPDLALESGADGRRGVRVGFKGAMSFASFADLITFGWLRRLRVEKRKARIAELERLVERSAAFARDEHWRELKRLARKQRLYEAKHGGKDV